MTLIDRIRDWRHARRIEAELRRIDDRGLHDLGIPRWRIRDVARGQPIEARLVL